MLKLKFSSLLLMSIITLPGVVRTQNAPTWTEDLVTELSAVGIRENTLINTPLGTLVAVDPDGGSVTYSTNSDVVSVNSASGEVRLAKEIDREVDTQIPVRFVARDSSGQEVVAEYAITILDVQDTAPVFENTPISVIVPENTPANTPLGTQIVVYDGDRGVPNDLSITITEDQSGLFALGPITISENKVYSFPMRTTGVLDREVIGSTYTFQLMARELENGAETGMSTSTPVTVTLSDVNDNPPRFNKDVYNITLHEGHARGTQLPGLGIVVTDSDENSNAHFEVEIRDIDGNRFSEPKSRIYSLSPSTGISQAAITISINDTGFFDYEKPEYRLHQFELVAHETETAEMLSSTATVHIHISDVNDNFPLFDRPEYTVSVREDKDAGYNLITITATDADSFPFDQVTYSLTGTGSDAFLVDETTGVIRLARQLDYETDPTYDLEYSASDGQKVSIARLLVLVLDINDQGPVFDPDQYTAFVPETSIELEPPITVSASDRDSDLPVTYRIIGGNVPPVFSIGETSGVLTLSRPVRFDETPNQGGTFRLEVEASDNGTPVPQTSTVFVIINVRDENDRVPTFLEPEYRRTISETTPPETPVVTVEAEDFDAGLNAQIDYIIHSGSIDNFEVDMTSGEITVAPGANLDIDVNGAEYRMIVHAVDRGSPPNTGTATVYVTVTDVNNKLPRFGQNLYILTVPDSEPVDTPVGRVTADDLDESANLRYRIQDGSIMALNPAGNPVTDTDVYDYPNAFRVEPTSGEIVTSLPLNHNLVNRMNFTVTVEDMNAEDPAPQQSTTLVEITILRSGGTDVTFAPPWSADDPEYIIPLPEEDPIGSEFIQLVAQDPVTGNVITNYREVEGSDPNNYFTVNPQTGQISNARRLDYETMPQKNLTLQVVAMTEGPEVRSAVATIRVYVYDINDRRPEFDQNRYDYSVPENSEYPTEVGRVMATDGDTGNYSVVTYSLHGQGSEMFYIDPEEGIVYIAPNVTLDREEAGVYTLFVAASDVPGVERRTEVPLRITVEDENDNSPVFTRNVYEIYTPDQREKDKVVGQVSARDLDAGNNGKVTFQMLTTSPDFDFDQQIPGLFYVQSNGTIRVNRSPSLNGTARAEPYQFIVRAQDSGAAPQYADATVRIYIQDPQTQGGKPTIEFPSEDGAVIDVDEELEPGTNVTQIIGSSGDSTQVLEYGFVVNDELDDDANRFRIDPVTGVITVRERLDRETQTTYQLIIVVRDSSGQEEVRRIFIELTDVNDNMPSFDCPGSPKVDPVRASVLENLNSTAVVELQACDPDGLNVTIHYHILAGNDRDEFFNDEKPFKEIGTDGVLFTSRPLDREHIETYYLTVLATNSPNLTTEEMDIMTSTDDSKRRKRQAQTRDDVITVVVTVEDVDDNGPSFDSQTGGTGNELVAGVLMTARPGTQVTRLRAADSDVTSVTYYSLHNQFFEGRDGSQDRPLSFTIDELSGVVETNLEEYVRYVDGYFTMTARATDRVNNEVAEAKLTIYVVRESQRLRFVFDKTPDETHEIREEFLTDVSEFFPDSDINTDSLHYHARKTGRVDFEKSDLCFHMVKNSRVVNADVAMDEFDLRLRRSTELRETYDEYDMILIDVCEIKTTTRWWSGWWWLWWILIAYALFIFLVALICIIFICVCWPRYKDRMFAKEKPPKMFLHDQSSILPPVSDYEWQEDVIKMD